MGGSVVAVSLARFKARFREDRGWAGRLYQWLFRRWYDWLSVWRSLGRKHLALGYWRRVVEEWRADQSLGVATCGVVELDRLRIESPNRRFGVRYQPTAYRVFARVLARLDEMGLDYRRTVLVDLGCGKGRVLVLAKARPFGLRIGVEFSRALCDVALANLRRSEGTDGAYQVVCGDVAGWPLPDQDLLIYCYNPFGEPVMRAVLAAIAERVRRSDRPVALVYANPVLRRLVEESPFLTVVAEEEGLVIYRSLRADSSGRQDQAG